MVTRRTVISAAAVGLGSHRLVARSLGRPQSGQPFLWGAATSGHQVEGNNINADIWALENVPDTMFAQRSGDACDHYHRYGEDIEIMRDLGFNCYRLSVEWSRIEPSLGEFSNAELNHYRRVLATCRDAGLAPVVSFNHFTTPRWFAARGGWEAPDAGDLFVRYCERVAGALGDLISVATTFNEPQLARLIRWRRDMRGFDASQSKMVQQAAKACGSDRFQYYLSGNLELVEAAMIAAHHRAYTVMKGGRGQYPVGVTLAMSDDQAVGPGSLLAEKRAFAYDAWLEASAKSDFVGVQAYTRTLIGPEGPLPVPAGAERTLTNWEYYPEALEGAIRYAAQKAGVPVYVTENGVAVKDDVRRSAYIEGAVAGMKRCIADGIDVRGYIHWALLDNFEWASGFAPTFGLVAVDRSNQKRSVKSSARTLARLAKQPSTR